MSSVSEKIPIGEVAGAAIGFAWNNFFTLIRIGWFPILISTFFSYVGDLAALPVMPVWATQINPAIFQISYVLAFVCWAIFAVSVHRMILVEQEAPSGFFYFRVTGDEIRYALAPIVIGIIPALIMGGGYLILSGSVEFLEAAVDTARPDATNIEDIAGWRVAMFILSLVMASYVYLRLVLSLPIIAAENKFGLFRSWSLTSGNFWRMILVYLLLGLTLAIVYFGITLAVLLLGASGAGLGISPTDGGVGTTITIGAALTGAGFGFFLNFVGTVIFIAVLSFMYQALTDEGISASDRVKSLKSSGSES